MSKGSNLTSTQVYVLKGLSSLDIAVLTAELDMMLKDSRISNIYQLNGKILLLNLRKPKGIRENLLIQAGRRLHITTYVFEKPLKPPDFCMALRKYLRNGRIKKIQQHDFERIVELIVESKAREYRLVVELFGEGNIILVNSDNKILHALTYRRMKDRNIIRSEIFKYPPLRGRDPESKRFDPSRGFWASEENMLKRFLHVQGFKRKFYPLLLKMKNYILYMRAYERFFQKHRSIRSLLPYSLMKKADGLMSLRLK